MTMTSEFSILAEWSSSDQGSPEVRETSAFLSIRFGNHIATRAEDEWSKSVRTNVRVSAYPLALWLAASWWRLRWEPSFENVRTNRPWRMAHETSASGYGFIWPRLIFESDGENIDATCLPSSPVAAEPIRYLENFRTSISSKSFESAVDEFVSLVLARLEAVGVRDSPLQKLWPEIKDEQGNADATAHRRFEAQLGFEPDEAPEDVLDNLIALADEVGEGAMSEVASVCSGENPKSALQGVVDLANANGVEGELDIPKSVARFVSTQEFKAGMPWDRGRKLAHAARAAWGVGDSRLSDKSLSEIIGVAEGALDKSNETPDHLPLGLAVRGTKGNKWKLMFRRKARTGRRFEAARLLCDYMAASLKDRWLPTTDAKTARQKIQRAFAAEFLCPISSLKYWLEDDYSSESIDEAGDYFGLSPLAIRSHLANHGLIHSFEVGLSGI